MEYFFLRFFVLGLFLFLFLRQEFKQRKENGLQPTKLSELFNMGAKWKKGSDPKITALLFAASSFLGFSLWESFIILIFNLFPYLFLTFPVGIALSAYLLKKRESFHPWTFKETQMAFLSLGLLTGALFCWVLFPWLYFRSLFLKKS